MQDFMGGNLSKCRPSGALPFGELSQALQAPPGLLQPGLIYDSPPGIVWISEQSNNELFQSLG